MTMRSGFCVFTALCAVAVITGGCATEKVAARQLAEMQEQVSKMQAENDKFDKRIGALEVAIADEKDPVTNTTTAANKPPSSGAAIGSLPVRAVQLGGPDEEAADPNDGTPRPDIRLAGQAGGITAPRPRSGAQQSRPPRGRVEDPEPGPRSDSLRPSALDPEAKKAYEAALAQVQAKQFDRGLEGLNAFLVRWPDHPYAENAIYWRGEAYFAQGEYLRAAEQFEAVLARFGAGTKGPDALLKIGMCHDRLGAPARAREYWDRLKNEFPRSDAAKKIPASGRDTTPSSPKGPKENR
jgi:tol-pal system protein YbgF